MSALTAVIPVRDDAGPLALLLAQALALGVFARIVVVDDGSAPALTAAVAPPGAPAGWLEILRRDTAGGPGRARNLGAARVASSHLVFLDADDSLTPDFAALWADLSGRAFDFCLFRHADSRIRHYGGWGQTAHDEGLWIAAGADRAVLGAVTPAAARHLVETANYPWNKIYRRAFLADHGIGCAEMRLHEDIRLHWQGFLAARTILASNRIGLLHRVGGAGRMTAREGPERMQVFAALEEVSALVPPDSDWFLSWAAFASRLCDWAEMRVGAAGRDPFRRRRRQFLAGLLPGAAFARLAAARPGVAARVLRQMAP